MDDNYAGRRQQARLPTQVYGRFRHHGRAYEVPLQDLSEKGCRFADRQGKLKAGDRLILKIAGLGPFHATVRWRGGHYVGTEFDLPLYRPVFDHIISLSRSGKVEW